jgi:hypothetical protein
VANPANGRRASTNVRDAFAGGDQFAFRGDLPVPDAVFDQWDGTITTRRFAPDGRAHEVTIRAALADPLEWTVTYEFTYVDVESGETVATTSSETIHVRGGRSVLLERAGFVEWILHTGPDLAPFTNPREPAVRLARR